MTTGGGLRAAERPTVQDKELRLYCTGYLTRLTNKAVKKPSFLCVSYNT